MAKKKILRGHFYSINNKRIKGHKGRIVNVKKNKVKAVVVTHAPRTRGRKNIRLKENPNKKDSSTAYVLKTPQYASVKEVGTHRKDMKVSNKQDKSLFRKIGRKK